MIGFCGHKMVRKAFLLLLVNGSLQDLICYGPWVKDPGGSLGNVCGSTA